jgi:uncharacterized protein (TIGR03437 family)
MMRHLLVSAAIVAALRGQTFTTIANFGGNLTSPTALILGPDGNFYGAATSSSNAAGPSNMVTLFQMTLVGTLASLATIRTNGNGTQMVAGQDGRIYIVIEYGGQTEQGGIYELTTSGTLTLLYSFGGGATPMQEPVTLVQAPNGTFYGSTRVGAGPGGAGFNGSIFSAQISGGSTTLSTIYSYPNIGFDYAVALTLGTDGNIYGVESFDAGRIFRLAPSGTYTVLYELSSPVTDGYGAESLVRGADGNFYGFAGSGGANGSGTIFKITPLGAYTVLYNFPVGGGYFGAIGPQSLLQGADGSLYGATAYGGTNNSGSIYRITTSGAFTTLYSFPTGSKPGTITLAQAKNGTLYGVTSGGGTSNAGTAFILTLSGSSGGTYECSNATPPVITSVDSASAYGGYSYFASGSWLEIKGMNLADPNDPRLSAATNPGQWTMADFNGSNAPTSLDGISAMVNGKPAYIWYLSPTQINVQAPEDTFVGSTTIAVTNCKATSPAFGVSQRALAPGLLSPAAYGSPYGGEQYLVATFASDGAYVLNTSLGASFGLNSRPAKPGDVIVAYGIGFGDVTPSMLPGTIAGASNTLVNPVTISFGGSFGGTAPTVATVGYQGLAGGFVGLYEFYVTVPNVTSGDHPINVMQGGVALPQTLYLTVQD